MKVRANGIDIEVEDSGPPSRQAGLGGVDADPAQRPAVLLIMGMGMQLVAWPDAFLSALMAAGYRVIRMDNRDSGLSQKFTHLGRPNVVWESLKYKLGLTINPPYRLHDMAADALGVLNALGVARAHVVGVSLGGMVAQRLALAAPARCASLSSIMSSSSARGLPQAEPHVLRVLLKAPRNPDTQAVVAHYVRLFKTIGSPGFPEPEDELRERITLAAARNFCPDGSLRQAVAVAADSQRAFELPRITAPTLVIHGKADPLIPVACGHDTARRIPGARMLAIDGMGHDLPRGVVQRILPPLLQHFDSSNPVGQATSAGAA
jgi:pimeloyl-ACP methyl ester carboxylesterase